MGGGSGGCVGKVSSGRILTGVRNEINPSWRVMEDTLLAQLHRAHSRSHDRKSSMLSTIITTVGNFGVQMNYQAISVALIVMSVDVCTKNDDECKDGEQQPWVSSSATAVVFAGSIVGQLTMGFAGDILGRTTAMGLTQFIAVISALFSALISMGSAEQVYSTIITCRFFLGIGLGGVYPLAATKAAEDGSSGGTNPAASAKSFFWQTPGSLAPWFLALLFTTTDLSANMKWRLLLGLGAIPGIIVFTCVLLENKATYQKTHKPSIDLNAITRKESVVSDRIFHTSENWYKLIGTGESLLQPRYTWPSLLPAPCTVSVCLSVYVSIYVFRWLVVYIRRVLLWRGTVRRGNPRGHAGQRRRQCHDRQAHGGHFLETDRGTGHRHTSYPRHHRTHAVYVS